MLKNILLMVLTTLTMGGCLAIAPPLAPILPEQTYQGYPCFDYCEEFKSGFIDARERGIKTFDGCVTAAVNARAGCKAYVAEEDWLLLEKSDLKIKD